MSGKPGDLTGKGMGNSGELDSRSASRSGSFSAGGSSAGSSTTVTPEPSPHRDSLTIVRGKKAQFTGRGMGNSGELYVNLDLVDIGTSSAGSSATTSPEPSPHREESGAATGSTGLKEAEALAILKAQDALKKNVGVKVNLLPLIKKELANAALKANLFNLEAFRLASQGAQNMALFKAITMSKPSGMTDNFASLFFLAAHFPHRDVFKDIVGAMLNDIRFARLFIHPEVKTFLSEKFMPFNSEIAGPILPFIADNPSTRTPEAFMGARGEAGGKAPEVSPSVIQVADAALRADPLNAQKFSCASLWEQNNILRTICFLKIDTEEKLDQLKGIIQYMATSENRENFIELVGLLLSLVPKEHFQLGPKAPFNGDKGNLLEEFWSSSLDSSTLPKQESPSDSSMPFRLLAESGERGPAKGADTIGAPEAPGS